MLLKIKKDMKGITLIALVITIIVLLILAGVSIATLTGQNGILTQANTAKTQTAEAKNLEQVKLAVSTGVSENLTTGRNVNEAIQEELRKTDPAATVVGDGDEKEITYNGKLYNANIKTGEIEETTQGDLSNKSIKLIVNTGEDGLVVLPFDEENSGNVTKVNWGDGNVETIGKEDYEEKGKIASTTNNIQVAATVIYRGIYHKYNEKNKEIEVEVEGNIVEIGSYAARMYYDKELGESVDYEEGANKIIEITQWGETGLEEIYLGGCRNLRKIASPTENSFKNITKFSYTFFGCTGLTSIPEDLFANCPNVTDFYGTFVGCTGLTSIPEDLFANCPNVTNFSYTFGSCTGLTSIPENLFVNCPNVTDFLGTFTECTNLTGNAIPLWERVEGYENLDFEDIDAWVESNPWGMGCYYNCTKLNNYNNIPMYWKSSPSTSG